MPSSRKVMMILDLLSNKSKFKNGLVEKFWDKQVSWWETVEDCRRSRGEDIRDFVDRFDTAYEAVRMVCGMIIPSTVRASMLLRRAEIEDKIRRNLILSKLDYEREDTLHDQMETQILEVLGGGP